MKLLNNYLENLNNSFLCKRKKVILKVIVVSFLLLLIKIFAEYVAETMIGLK